MTSERLSEGIEYGGREDPREIGRLVLDTIQSRRSIREGYIDKPIPDDMITEIINSGITAPSSKNAQPWRVHVVHQGSVMENIADDVQTAKDAERYTPIDPSTGKPREWQSTVAASAQILRKVSVGLFTENIGEFSGGKKNVLDAKKEHQNSAITGYSFEMVSLGAMIQNMWLGAHAQGLNGVFMGDVAVAEEKIQSRLGFNGDLVGVLALGYADQQPHPKQLKSDTVVFHNSRKQEH